MFRKGKKSKKVVKEIPGFYKGYDIKWLKGIPKHPDYHLVAENEDKQKKVHKVRYVSYKQNNSFGRWVC